jgi:hypothetical protein
MPLALWRWSAPLTIVAGTAAFHAAPHQLKHADNPASRLRDCCGCVTAARCNVHRVAQRTPRGARASIPPSVLAGSLSSKEGDDIESVIDGIESRATARRLRRFLAEDPSKHFSSIDSDGSGEISFEEWERAFGNTAFSPYLRTLFDEIDTDRSGFVSYKEFMEVVKSDQLLGNPWVIKTKNKIEDNISSSTVTLDRHFQEGTPMGNIMTIYMTLKQYLKAVDLPGQAIWLANQIVNLFN